MKKYVFTIDTKTSNIWQGRIFHVSNNNLNYVTDFSFSPGYTKGTEAEAFQALINCNEIPKKWYTSSECTWRGPGYFYGEVTKHYSIKQI